MHRQWKSVVACLLVVACSSEQANDPAGTVVVDQVVISPLAPSASVGQQVQFTATTYDADGNVLTGRAFTWTSTNPAVAMSIGNGAIEAKGAGTSTVRASSEGKSAETILTVSAPPPPPSPQVGALTKVSGDAQSATYGRPLSAPLVVKVVSQAGAPMAGVTVTWTAPDGGTLSSGSSATDASGQAQIRLTLGSTFFLQRVTATVGTRSVTFTATGNGSGDLQGRRLFPVDNAWNRDVSADPVDPNSAALIASCGATRSLHPDFGTVWNGAPNGIPYIVVRGSQGKVPVTFQYSSESDPGPYPIPPNAPIEGGPSSSGDRHVLVVDWDNWKLYELFAATPQNGGQSWTAGSGAVFDLGSNALRPAGWTSADAAGLPILPGLVRYDEVAIHGAITHALRFTCPQTRKAYVHPARHWASSNTSATLPPMGMRVRLKASYDISSFSPRLQVILRALKTYGMLVADNGSGFFLSGAPDPRWDDSELHDLQRVMGADFEVVEIVGLVTP